MPLHRLVRVLALTMVTGMVAGEHKAVLEDRVKALLAATKG